MRLVGLTTISVWILAALLAAPAPAGEHVVGQGLGQPNPNRVRVFAADGTPSATDFFAYSTGQWGVNVAAGAIDAGTEATLLTGPGPGTRFGPQVRGFDGDGLALARINFYAYGTLRYGVNVATGDLEGDGFDELISGAGWGGVFGPHLRGFDYDGAALKPLARINFFAYSTLKYGVNPAEGDLDGEGWFELLSGPGPGPIFAPNVRGFDFDGAAIQRISGVNFNAFTGGRFGVNPAGGDADGDGVAEIAAAPGPGAGASFPARFRGFSYSGSGVAPLPGFDVTTFASRYGGRVALSDLDGGGAADLLAGAGPDPASDSRVESYAWDGAALNPNAATFVPFSGTYGVNLAGAALSWQPVDTPLVQHRSRLDRPE